jgi:predicted porin
MKKLLSILLLTTFSLASYAGGHAMSDNGHNAMSSAKSSSGVHFYGRMYVGYDDRSVDQAADDESLEDGGNMSRLGLKFKENLGGGLQLIGQLEYKFDGIDGTSEDNTTNCANTNDCRTFNLHVGNLGFKTAYGYIGAGTYESPYKTMGQFDHNIDTAWALNQHGGTSMSAAGIDGNLEGMLSYHNKIGPIEVAYMYAVNDSSPVANVSNNSNTSQGDYSMGIQLKDMFISGLVLGYSKGHAHDDGTSNTRFYASMKVMPNAGVFVSLEDLEVDGSFNSTTADGEITTIGTHYSLGSTDLQAAYAKGDADGVTGDYKTLALSAKMKLSKVSDITFGYAKQDFDLTGSDVTTRGIGLTHRF